jgi:hypothetical protein
MRIFKIIGVVALVLALSAITVATASADLLPGTKGVTIKGSSGKATLQVKGGAAITCKESTTTGEVLSSAESLLLINFGANCTAGGLPVKSSGDASGTILAHVEAGSCHVGGVDYIIFAVLPIKLEVPSTKLTLEVTGAVLGEVTPGNTKQTTFTVTLAQKSGEQTTGPKSCEDGGVKKSEIFLKTSTDGGAAVESGQEAEKGSLTFSAAQEFM